MELITTRELENFGGNLNFTPEAFYEPIDEAELLRILDRHSNCTFRAVGKLHSWSPVAQNDQIILSLRLFRQVQLEPNVASARNSPSALDSPSSHLSASSSGQTLTPPCDSVWVGAGLQIKHLIAELAKVGLTMPSLGLVSEQTIAGAVSTGTHGSGRHCLSEFVQAVRVARFDSETRLPIIETIESGPKLAALKCGLGNLGIITAIRLDVRPVYQIQEHWHSYDSLSEVLEAEPRFPLQQFFLLPWKWTYYAQHRLETREEASWIEWLYRIYFFIAIDVCLHLVLLTAARWLGSKRLVQWLFKKVLWRTIIQDWNVTGPSHRMLIMEHQLFEHIETELFVRRSQLDRALEYLQRTLLWTSGDGAELPDEYLQQVAHTGLMDAFQAARDVYCHHYPICIRRILPDNTLVSMTSGGHEDWYSISLISYHRRGKRSGFFKAMNFIARSMAILFNARPHWGKHIPLGQELTNLYPNWEQYQEVARQLDPQRQFCNCWFKSIK